MTKRKSKFRDKVAHDTNRQKTAGSSYGYLRLPKGLQVFQPKGGRIKMDILPYIVSDENHPDKDVEMEIAIPGELWYKRPFKVHRNIGVDNETVICLTSFGERCPICEYRAKRIKEGAEKEEVDPLRPSQRNLYAINPIGSKDFEEMVHVWDISQYLFQNLLNEELEEDPDYAVFPDLEEGLTLKVRFEEQQLGTNKFYEAGRIDFLERDDVYTDDILEEVPDLDKLLAKLSYEELDAKFMEYEVDDAEEVADDKPTRKRKKIEAEEEDDTPVKSTRRRKKEVEVDDDPEEDDGQDDDPPAPTRTRKKKEAAVVEEDDDPPPIKQSRNKGAKDKNRPKPGKESDDGERCPYGHRFGVDTDDFDHCDTCEIWDECIEEKEA